VRRCEWEMLLPKPGPLPQTSQLAATGVTPRLQIIYVRKPRLNQRATRVDRTGTRGEPGPFQATEAAYNACFRSTKLPRPEGLPRTRPIPGRPGRPSHQASCQPRSRAPPDNLPASPRAAPPRCPQPRAASHPEETWCCTRSTPRPCGPGAGWP
jgi:hypothetical protein